MKRVLQSFLMAIIFIVFTFTGQANPIGPKTPSEVVKAAYMSANKGLYSEVKNCMSSEALTLLKGELGAMVGGLKGVWDEATHQGNINKIEILKEEVRGEGAKVYVKLTYKDGSTKNDDESLIKENGEWKISVSL